MKTKARTCRFVGEYANYVKDKYREADIPKEQKRLYLGEIDMILKRANWTMPIADAMEMLAKMEIRLWHMCNTI